MKSEQTVATSDSASGLPPGSRKSLKRTLLLWFLATSILPLTAVSAICFIRAKESLRNAAYQSLANEVEEKAAFVNNWFKYRFVDLESQATSLNNARFLGELRDTFQASGKTIGSFVKSYQWNMIADKYSADLQSFRRMYDYHDVFLIDNEGNVLFTIAGKDDFGTNLFVGPYSETNFATVCHKALKTGRSAFSDLEYYAPSDGAAAGFLASVIVNEQGDRLGVLAIQIRIDAIENGMVQKAKERGSSVSYLVGNTSKRGVTLRTTWPDTYQSTENFAHHTKSDSVERAEYLNRRVDTEQTRLWTRQRNQKPTAAGHTANHAFVYRGPAGVQVLGMHKDIMVGEVRWGLIAEIEEQVAFAPAHQLRILVVFLVLATVVIVIVIVTFVTARIVRPIVGLSNAARLVAEGDLTQIIESGSTHEIGALASSFNEMVVSLREAAILQESQDWFKTGQTGLGNQLRGVQEIAPLARNIVTYLAKYLDAQVGAFYVPTDGQQLKLVGSYAFRKRKNLANLFDLGEGLVGQAALEREHIWLTGVPDDYMEVCSGLGAAPPRNIVVWPIVHQDEVKGVIELGSLEPFEERGLDLLNQVTESIGIALDVAQARQRLQELLNKSRMQSEKLQAQTEALQAREGELKNSNRNLAEKTAKLQASEETLQQQSDQLQASNEELEEKTKSLQKQKTEIELAKREVEEKAEEVALASKYKSEFLANMSHELRTPLNSLLILAKSLADNDQGNLQPDQVEAANVIHGGGLELLTLINDILDLAKVESGKLDAHIGPVNLRALVDGLGYQFSPQAKQKGLAIEIDLVEGLEETLLTDGKKVEQVLRNLMSNALKFTETGSITLRVSYPDANTKFSHGGLTPGTAIAFSVIDTGIGIPPDQQQAIFMSFQQADGSTSRQYGGTGLGLTISREFAKLLNGEILLHSCPGEGSTFTLYLPRVPMDITKAESRVEAGATMPSDAVDPQPQRNMSATEVNGEMTQVSERPLLPDDRDQLGLEDRTILIVEDDTRFAKILIDLCRKKSFKCLVAGTGSIALQMVADYDPSGILLDLGLPDMDGMVVLDELKQNLATRHIPIHIVSGREQNLAALSQGAIGFLNKPVSADDVMQALDKVEKLLDSTVKRILVIEDDQSIQQFIAKTVQFKGVEIIQASSGGEGYQKLLNGPFDCLILDLGLEDMNGYELLRKLDEQAVSIPPVIIYSNQKLSASERQGLAKYGCSLVRKDVAAPEYLTDKVSLFLHSVESELSETQQRAIRMLHDSAEQLHNKKVLLVDDDMRNTFALSNVLEKAGMQVVLAENGRQALDRLEREEDIDLVLMDIMMPIMDGYEAMRCIRQQERTAQLPIIALTAKAMTEDRAKCLKAGANDYLTKPVDIDQMLSLIRVWISNQSIVCN